MHKLVLVCVISALVASDLVMGQAFAADSPNVSKAVAAAVADSSRPATDSERDTDRKPAETLAFAGVAVGPDGYSRYLHLPQSGEDLNQRCSATRRRRLRGHDRVPQL